MTRGDAREQVYALLGPGESTEHLLDFLEDAWQTVDWLTEAFGSEQADALLLARSCFIFPESTL
jgi:hypothetical protein